MQNADKKPDWAQRELVFPWDDHAFLYSKHDKKQAYDFLRKEKYPLDGLAAKPTDEKLLKAFDQIMPKLLKRDWVMAVSNHAGLLQALAVLCPICFVLTTMDPCATVSTSEWVRVFSARPPQDPWGHDPVSEDIDRFTNAGLLVWPGITEQTRGARLQGGKFYDLLTTRQSLHYPLLATAVYSVGQGGTFTEAVLKSLMHSLEETLGSGPSIILQEKLEIVNFMVPQPKLHVTDVLL